jgi:hypothetical protein
MSKESCREYITHDQNNCTKPASTFVQVDDDFTIGVDSHSWHILQGGATSMATNGGRFYGTPYISNVCMGFGRGPYRRAALKA